MRRSKMSTKRAFQNEYYHTFQNDTLSRVLTISPRLVWGKTCGKPASIWGYEQKPAKTMGSLYRFSKKKHNQLTTRSSRTYDLRQSLAPGLPPPWLRAISGHQGPRAGNLELSLFSSLTRECKEYKYIYIDIYIYRYVYIYIDIYRYI